MSSCTHPAYPTTRLVIDPSVHAPSTRPTRLPVASSFHESMYPPSLPDYPSLHRFMSPSTHSAYPTTRLVIDPSVHAPSTRPTRQPASPSIQPVPERSRPTDTTTPRLPEKCRATDGQSVHGSGHGGRCPRPP